MEGMEEKGHPGIGILVHVLTGCAMYRKRSGFATTICWVQKRFGNFLVAIMPCDIGDLNRFR